VKNFFYTLFGGGAAILCGILIALLIKTGWTFLKPYANNAFSRARTAITETTDGTSISGFVRTIRFSASEEEDPLDSITKTYSDPSKPISAAAYMIKKVSGTDVPIEKNSDTLLPIASLTKLVTAEVARQVVDPGNKITITRDIMATYGNTAEFEVGETFKAADLYYPLLMVSSNDAAEALARSYGRKKFVQAMNDFTQYIGAYRTYFADPSGLSPANVSTASDLALILDWIRVNDPDVILLTSTKSVTIRTHTWVNPTHFLNLSNYVGGKNGYIPESNRTAASLFTVGKNKDLYAVVVLGSDARDADELKLIKKVSQ
jgi:D-alanyl-D-alanine carboxypeptidase